MLGFAAACGKNPTTSVNTTRTGDNNRDLMQALKIGEGVNWNTGHMLLDPGHDDYFNSNIPNSPDPANSAFLDPFPVNPETPPG